jgi:hypothetical protein
MNADEILYSEHSLKYKPNIIDHHHHQAKIIDQENIKNKWYFFFVYV